MGSNIKIVVIGGGNGTSMMLRGLKKYSDDITAIVAVADDGGSTGKLKRQLGIKSGSDLRRAIEALSDEELLVKISSYRFDQGVLEGHLTGNIFLAAAEKFTGDLEEALKFYSDLLKIKGRVIPVTEENARLEMDYINQRISGEHNIDGTQLDPLINPPRLFLEPDVEASAEACQAILTADLVVIAPGSLYTSLGSALVTHGISNALKSTQASVVYVCNLVNVPHQTKGFYVQNYADEIERITTEQFIDYVVYNDQLAIHSSKSNLELVNIDPSRDEPHYRLICGDIISRITPRENNADDLSYLRSLINHDSGLTAKLIIENCLEHAGAR